MRHTRLAGAVTAAATVTFSLTLQSPVHAQVREAVIPELTAAPAAVQDWQHPAQQVAWGHPVFWKVQSGQTLTAISAAHYHQPNAWPLIYDANTNKIKWADRIGVGQVLILPAYASRIPQPPRWTSPPPPPPPKVVYHAPVYQVQAAYQAPVQQAPAYQAPVYHAPVQQSGTFQGSGGMQQCIIRRESGGNSQVMNGSGHYGLYQFSEQTWVAHGGNPGSFGNASVSEQNQVYSNTVSADGYSDWAPYDGC